MSERRRWFEGFNDDQVSMILTCLANRMPLCCEADGRVNRKTITASKKLGEQLATYAYESWGCLPPERRAEFIAKGQLDRLEQRNEMLDYYYYERALEELQS